METSYLKTVNYSGIKNNSKCQINHHAFLKGCKRKRMKIIELELTCFHTTAFKCSGRLSYKRDSEREVINVKLSQV